MRLWAMVGVLAAAGCGGGAGRSDGGTGAGGATGGGGQSGGGGDGAPGAGVQVFSGTASMLFDGPSCTGETGAAGDRWCAFVARGDGDDRTLFVIDVSKVAAGIEVHCAATAGDPSCLLLTPALGGDYLDPTLHGTFFQGDTLVYYDAALVPHVWRPGMAQGRVLAVPTAAVDLVFCTPATLGTAVACLALPVEQAEVGISRGELLAGKADGPTEPLLTAIDAVIAANAADRGGTPRFGYGFPPVPGDYVAWTTRETADGPEVLKLHRAGEPASRFTIATDVHAWDVSPDGTRWFWQRAIDRSGIGTLQTAPFPSGAAPADVQEKVYQYGLPPTGGQAVVTLAQSGALAAIPDPVGAPGVRIPLDTQVQGLHAFGAQGHIAYVKHYVGANLIDLFVKKVDGSAGCVVDTTVQVPYASVQLSPDAGAVLWARSKAVGFEGLYTRFSDCTTMTLAPDVVAHGAIGHGAIMFMDQFDEQTRTGSMRFRTVAAGNTLGAGGATLVADGVDTYAISGPAPGALVYTINAPGPTDGVYVRWFGP